MGQICNIYYAMMYMNRGEKKKRKDRWQSWNTGSREEPEI